MHAVRNYQQGVQRLLAACDEELLGQVYQEGKFRLDVAASFYDDLRVDDEHLEAMLRQCTVANLVGPRTVAKAVELGLVNEANVLRIDGVPHAQLLVMES
ncbi:MAG: DUF424 domain-containing protein [Thermoplasmatota archaeon]